MSVLLSVQNISKKFGGIIALRDISMEVEEHQILAIIGPNGSGKTTLLNVITGVYIPEEGTINLLGKEIQGKSAANVCIAGISRTFQNVRVFKSRTVLDNILIGSTHLYKNGLLSVVFNTTKYRQEDKEHKQKAMELLKFVGLEGKENIRAENLPYAQQRFLEIARALATQPKILLLDEPAAGMNAHEIDRLSELIIKIRDSGMTIIMIEHIMDLVRDVADSIYVMSNGEKIAQGNYQEIEKNPFVIEAYLGKGAH